MEHKLLNKLKQLQESFPEDKHVLNDLYYDAVDQSEKAHWSFLTYIVPSWGFLFGYTAMKGPLPILRRQGRFLGTHRVVRQYAYAGLVSAAIAYYPFYKVVNKTMVKLETVEANKKASDADYVRPKLPIYYPNN